MAGDERISRTVTTVPFAISFFNVNTKLRLPGHWHFATITLIWDTLGPVGFPSFADTNEAIQSYLKRITAKPFKDATNEDVADSIFERINHWEMPEVITRYGGRFSLSELQLSVRGVPDDLNHADGFTTYTVRRSAH
jgi:hypothetical protein